MSNDVERPPSSESPDAAFEELLRRMREGCPVAAEELFRLYSKPLRILVRRRLHRRLRTLYDSLDFVQSVWASFLGAPEPGAFTTPKMFAAYLARVATNKVIEVHRQRMRTTKHDVSRVEHRGNLDVAGDVRPLTPPAPTASQVAIAEEHWERMMHDQPPEVREVLELLRQGHTHDEVAQRLGLHPKMIQRFLRKLRDRISRT